MSTPPLDPFSIINYGHRERRAKPSWRQTEFWVERRLYVERPDGFPPPDWPQMMAKRTRSDGIYVAGVLTIFPDSDIDAAILTQWAAALDRDLDARVAKGPPLSLVLARRRDWIGALWRWARRP